MKIGIVGMEYAGKKTLFNILSQEGKNLVKRGAIQLAITSVMDERLKSLSSLYHPKKTTFAQLEFILTPSLASEKKGSVQALTAIHAVDGIIIVVRDFALEGLDAPQAEKDLAFISSELVFSDLLKCESAMEKTEKRAVRMKDAVAEQEFHLLRKVKAWLEQDKWIIDLDLKEEEKALSRTFDFLTEKPVFVLVNIDENDIGKENSYDFNGFPKRCLSLKIESEIFALEAAEQKAFLNSLGLKEPGLECVIRGCYKMTNLISFFTVGEDEVKAWTIPAGTKAKRSAGAIHSDIEKGFIRAEVVHCDDFAEAGSAKEAKKLNLYRLEGKEYPVKDGDIINFRFNL